MSNDRASDGTLCGKNVLVTGGMGFIGSNLVHDCVKRGANVTVYDCLDPRSGGNMFNLHDVRDKVECVNQDVLDFGELSRVVPGKDIIFNCAASTSHGFSMREPWIDLDVNSRGMINCLEAIRRFNPEVRFIHLGTSTQLGPLQYQPADEKHPEFPTDIYSANKSVSEKFALIYARAHGIRATVVRLSNVYGPRASIHSPDFTFNNFFIGLALQDRTITVYGEGTQKRNVIYVEDAVNALIATALHPELASEVLFAVGDEHYSVVEIARKTVEHIGAGKIAQIPWPSERKATEVGDAVISNAKAREVLDWQPRHTLESGLAKTRAYYMPVLEHYLR